MSITKKKKLKKHLIDSISLKRPGLVRSIIFVSLGRRIINKNVKEVWGTGAQDLNAKSPKNP